ncbi:MAG: hypothetical protein P4L44_09085 [Oryzomonas sp.]|uniref:hypothetical protein n=1 Tax=Oryzomonas sp. TaxID=2855186 RepID=UPI002842A558|nr:hypothetical protein [Oryzomonas sp.]MDR3580102.1 hypothetical protein [Oryzomonas sp.]
MVILFLIGSGLTGEVLGRTGVKPLAQGVILWTIVSAASAVALIIDDVNQQENE